MRLTPLSKLLLVLAIVVAVYFALRTFVLKKDTIGSTPANTEATASSTNTNSTEPATQNSDNAPVANNSDSNRSSTATATAPSFDYTPPAPVNGTLLGVVELGASGFNSFVARMDKDKRWKMERKAFGESLAIENMATTDDVKAGLKKYISQMFNFGVSNKDIHFVVSSGAAKSPEIVKISNALKDMKYVVNVVTPEQEGRYAFAATMPKDFEKDAFVVDIGSGNTKISWKENGVAKALEGSGAKYFQSGKDPQTVYNEIKALATKIPTSNRKMCFIIGGVPFELAKSQGQPNGRYTTLKKPDAYSLEGEKNKAGLNIYKAIADGTKCESFVFDWDSNFTIGFLLGLK